MKGKEPPRTGRHRKVMGFILKKQILFWLLALFHEKKLKIIPAATAEPITPATLGAIACIRR